MALLPDPAFILQTSFGFIPGTYVGLFSDIASVSQIASGGETVYYPEYVSFIEIEQPGNAFIESESKLIVPYNVPAITNVAPELLSGVTFEELEEIEALNPNAHFIYENQSLIGLLINEIQVDIKT